MAAGQRSHGIQEQKGAGGEGGVAHRGRRLPPLFPGPQPAGLLSLGGGDGPHVQERASPAGCDDWENALFAEQKS